MCTVAADLVSSRTFTERRPDATARSETTVRRTVAILALPGPGKRGSAEQTSARTCCRVAVREDPWECSMEEVGIVSAFDGVGGASVAWQLLCLEPAL